MSLFSFSIFTGISFSCEAFLVLELRLWISVRNFSLSSYLKENLLLFVSIRFLILTILGWLENFSMHAKTGLSWVFLEKCISFLSILKFLTRDLKKFWEVFATSVSLEIISSFSTSVIFSLDLILSEKRSKIFFQNFLVPLTNFRSQLLISFSN